MKLTFEKSVVSLFLVLWYFVGQRLGYPSGGLLGHIIYPLCHVNIFHLLANILCLCMIPCRLRLPMSYLIAVVCSFVPCFIGEDTLGFSGVLFAIVGQSWGRVGRFKDMMWKNKWFLFIPIFIPHVNALLHLYCLLLGYVVGKYDTCYSLLKIHHVRRG